ncbi:MAG: hypothetical protein ACTSVI_04650 [Promethearchaeota archaeon]
MGSRIQSILSPRMADLSFLRGKTIAIDSSIWLHQFLKTSYFSRGVRYKLTLMDKTCRLINHLRGFLYRTIFLLEHDIWPIFIFDGPTTRKLRNKDRLEFLEMNARFSFLHEDAMSLGMTSLARTIGQQLEYIYPIAEAESKKLLKYMGMPVITAAGEGEAQCAHAQSLGIADFTCTSDADALLYGCKHVITGLTASNNNKEITHHDLRENLSNLKISRSQLIDIAILVGTDYNKGINGIGPKKALKLIQEHETIENIVMKLDKKLLDAMDIGVKKKGHYFDFKDLDIIRSRFLEPLILDTIEEVNWQEPNDAMIKHLLLEEHSFSRTSISKALGKLHAIA